MSRFSLVRRSLNEALVSQDQAVRVAAAKEPMDQVRFKAGIAEGLRQALALIERQDVGE